MDSLNNNDPFKQFVKSKLANYKQDAPPLGWEELEQSLFAMQKTKVVHTKWILPSVAAVAAALIGVFLLFQNTSQELPIQTTENITKQQVTPTYKEDKSLITKQHSTKNKKSSTPLFSDNASLLQKKDAVAIKAIEEKQTITSSTTTDSSTPQTNEDDTALNNASSSSSSSSKEKNKLSDIDKEKKQQMIQDFINDGKRSSSNINNAKTTKKKSKHSISLTGQSAFSSSQESSTLPTTLRSSLNDTYSNYTMAKMKSYNEEEEVNPESEKIHRQPISFGVLTSFNLTKKLQVETGLIYTYLSSETKNESEDFRNGEKTQFHYLGIPINLNYTVLSVNKLDIFLTTGGMIEKDVYGKVKDNENMDKLDVSAMNSGYAKQTSLKISQKNPQFSLSGGVGMTYPLYNNAKLFGKIGGRYYINANNEYKTYYSDEKLGLDIQLGIKFKF